MRHIDADKLIEHINNMPWKMDSASEITKFIFLSTVEEAPTADVVSKSEVEVLIKSVDDMLDLVCAMTGLELTYLGKYAELKKKYTEEQE